MENKIIITSLQDKSSTISDVKNLSENNDKSSLINEEVKSSDLSGESQYKSEFIDI